MRFKQFLRENVDTGHAFIELRPVTDVERALIKKSQELSRVIHDALKLKNKLTIEDIEKLKKDFEHFTEFKFLKYSIDEIKSVLDKHGQMQSRDEHIAKNINSIKSSYAELKKSFMAGAHKDGAPHKEKLAKIIDKHDAHIDAPAHVARRVKNLFTNETSIFGTSRFLETLGDDDYEAIHRIDVNGPLYTMYDFPIKMIKEDWDHIVYFLTNLRTSGGHVEFKQTYEFRKYIRAKHAGDSLFDELLKVMDNYLHSNDKDLIPKIVELIEKIPEIKAANDKRKQQIKFVYRGLADTDMSEEEMIDSDRKRKFIATSESLYAAKNFALAKGHLDRDRRSETGHIIKYEVSPEAILFDTKVIATVYNESEVLIDATKALAKEVLEV